MPEIVQPTNFVIAPSAARTTLQSFGPFFMPPGYRGLRIFIDVTADPGTASLVFSIKTKSPVSGQASATLLDSAAVAAVTTAPVVMELYPGTVAVTNVVANRHPGRQVLVTVAVADAQSMTYSVHGEWLT